MAVLKIGPRSSTASRDAEGHRTVTTIYRVTFSTTVSAASAMNAAGLPSVGATYSDPISGDSDSWMFRLFTTSAKQVVTDGDSVGGRVWDVTISFSTKQPERCQDQQVEDPLSEPDRVSGSFVNYTIEAVEDKDGDKIQNSSHEQVRGPAVEFDDHRPTVVIGQNVASLGLETFSAMVNTVNDANLWGLAPRKIKLSNVSWSRQLYGLCYFYYMRTFEFDINFNTFDRAIVDEGTMVLGGQWQVLPDLTFNWLPNPGLNKANVKDFQRFEDPKGQTRRCLLDGNGNPLDDGAAPVEIPNSPIQYYTESNFLALGIPTSL